MKIRFGILALIASLFVSCKGIEPTPEPLSQLGYSSFYAAYKSGATVVLAEASGEDTNFELQDGSTFMVAGVAIEDCSKAAPKVVAYKDGVWMVGGVPTNVPRRNEETDEQSIIVYLYLTNLRIYAHLSNGNRISLAYSPKQAPGPDPGPSGFREKVWHTPEIKSYPSYGKVELPSLYLTVPISGYWNNEANQWGFWSSELNQWIVPKEDYVDGTIKITDPGKLYWDETTWEAPTKFRGRGNSTWGMPKKPYKIKLESKKRIFDMSKDKEWCILANYADKSLIRNLTAMEISRTLEFDWTPRMASVNVYMNGSYAGVYTFAEHKKVSTERVNIDIEGGDLYFEIETNMDEPVCWKTDHGMPMMFSEPSEPSLEVQAYARKYFQDFEKTLWDNTNNKKFDDPDYHYSQYIDVNSFIDYYIVQEITKNIDGQLKKSTFITLPLGGKLQMYHVWDFDLTMGNCDYMDNDGLNRGHGNGPTGWWIRDRACNGVNHGWFYRLFQDPAFKAKVAERWHQVYPALKANIPAFIKQQSDLLTDSGAQQKNFQKWNILNTYVWPNWKIPGSYKGEVDWLLEFYTKRIEWINDNIDK